MNSIVDMIINDVTFSCTEMEEDIQTLPFNRRRRGSTPRSYFDEPIAPNSLQLHFCKSLNRVIRPTQLTSHHASAPADQDPSTQDVQYISPSQPQREGTTRHTARVLEANTTYRPLSRNRYNFTNTTIVSFTCGDGSSSPGHSIPTPRPDNRPQISPRASGFEPPSLLPAEATATHGPGSVPGSATAYRGQTTPSLNLPPHLSLHLHTLVCLDIGRTTTSSSLFLLRTCTALQDLSICLIPDDPLSQSFPLPSQVLASQLHHLYIKTTGGDPRGIFTRLNTPVLESFTLVGEPHLLAMDDVFATSVTMLERSFARLHSLSLIDVFPATDKLERCLRGPGVVLSELVVSAVSFNRGRDIPTHFGNRVISDRFLDFLTAPSVCPSLKVLQLSPIRSADGVLSNLLSARARTITRFSYSFADGLLHRLDMLAMNGLDGSVVPLI